MSKLKYWLWLAGRKGLGTWNGVQLLERFGTPDGVYFAPEEEYEALPTLSQRGKESLADKDLTQAEGILGECDRLGYRLLTLSDAEYPDRLRGIEDPPLLLYLRGRLPHVDEELVIGMVGARKATPYGRKIAGEMAMDLCRMGAVLCSGVAEGIDSASIRGALAAGGSVISVVAGGLDVVQFGSSQQLYDDIAAAGALLSEYPPGTPCASGHFRPRNRIISGLSEGVVVVEGGGESGALITARAAFDQGREVFAVPGNVDSPMSAAPNRLLHEQIALAARDAADVLAEFTLRYPLRSREEPLDAESRRQRVEEVLERTQTARPAGPARAKRREGGSEPSHRESAPPREVAVTTLEEAAREGLTDDQRDILLTLEEKSLHPDELVETLGVPARRVLSALTLLQVQGYVKEQTGKRFTALVRLK